MRTLNAASDYDPSPTPSAFLNGLPSTATLRTQARRAARWVMMFAILVALGVAIGAHLDHDLYYSQAADVAGIVGQAGHAASTGAKWQAKAPTGSGKIDVFIRQTLTYARQAHDATGWPVALVLSQWFIEHDGYLPDRYVGDGYDVAHAVPFDSPQGTCLGYGENSDGTFCYAANMEQGLAIWLHVARLPFYAQVPIAAKQGDDAAAHALGASPWASSGYRLNGVAGGSLISVMREYNLAQYDK